MEETIFEIKEKIKSAYSSCSLKTVNAFNPYQFEKMLEVLFLEYSRKGIKKKDFDEIVNLSLKSVGAIYKR